jgi:hypothetical protein
MTKGTAIAKVEKFYQAATLAKLEEENKWGDKVEGLQALSKQIAQMSPDEGMVEATITYVKLKPMKGWKE